MGWGAASLHEEAVPRPALLRPQGVRWAAKRQRRQKDGGGLVPAVLDCRGTAIFTSPTYEIGLRLWRSLFVCDRI